MMPPLPVTLVTGFLGSGKTTLLARWAETRSDLRMQFLVNELSDTDVDALRLQQDGAESHAVVGGSIFCECKAADFLKMLREDVLPSRLSLDRLVVETSGIADPMAVGTLLEKAGVGDQVNVDQILTVVTPAKFLKLNGRLPVVGAQVEAADMVVVNKADLATEEEITSCLQAVGNVNEEAKVLVTSFGDGVDLGPSRSTDLPSAALTKCNATSFSSEQISPRSFESRSLLEKAFDDIPTHVHRIKGRAMAGETVVEVDYTPDGLTLDSSKGGDTGLVFIGEKHMEAERGPFIDRFRKKRALLACDVFQEELEAMEDLPPFVQLVWLPMGLHDRPAELRSRAQEELDRLDADPNVEEILMLYGLCGGGITHIKTQTTDLLIPRAHDCIALLLGSNQRHQNIQKQNPGTYFYAPGWIRERRVPGPDREAWFRKEFGKKYEDEDLIEDLIEADQESFGHYNTALFIQTAAAKEEEAYCQTCAEHLGWRFQVEKADPEWLRSFFHGPYPEELFVRLSPGETLELSADEHVFRVAAS